MNIFNKRNSAIKKVTILLLCFTMIFGNVVTALAYDQTTDLTEPNIVYTPQLENDVSGGINTTPQNDNADETSSDDQQVPDLTQEETKAPETVEESYVETQEETNEQMSEPESETENVEQQSIEELPIIYWNPQGVEIRTLEEELGTKPEAPLVNLDRVLEKAAYLRDKTEQEIIVYVMNPMKVEEGEHTYDGQGIQLKPWDERPEGDRTLFQIEGGSLTLLNTSLISEDQEKKENLIKVTEGELHIGEELEVSGSILMDYSKVKDPAEAPVIIVDKPLEDNISFPVQVIQEEVKKNVLARANYEGDQGLSKHFYLATDDENVTLEADETDKEVYITPFSIGKEVYWNVNPDDLRDNQGNLVMRGGNDANDGTSDWPVQSWKAAKNRLGAEGGTIYIMSTVIVGSQEFQDDLGNPVAAIDGDNKVVLAQFSENLGELFVIPPEKSLELSNIKLLKHGSNDEIVTIRVTESQAFGAGSYLGQLVIGENTRIEGAIQTELNPSNKSFLNTPTIKVITDTAPTEKYRVYYSSINDNLEFLYANVIEVPDGKDVVTDGYINQFSLIKLNIDAGWKLQKDSDAHSGHPFKDNVIEIDRDFVYTGVYLNGQDGNDAWLGESDNRPVKTFARARQILAQEINNMDPANRIIYLCGTVDIKGAEIWELNSLVGTDGLGAKVVACAGDDANNLFHHAPPEVMINVKDGGVFQTTDITIEYSHKVLGSAMIKVEAGGALAFSSGSVLSGAVAKEWTGTGIYVVGAEGKDTTVVMEENTLITKRGTGIYVTGGKADTQVIILGGTITGNNSSVDLYPGGGISITDATVTMQNGEISSNVGAGNGGGVAISGADGLFLMNGGTIKANNLIRVLPIRHGLGVSVEEGTFKLTGGTIQDNYNTNYATIYGGGVYVGTTATMEMSGGTISGNSSVPGHMNGGGIYTDGTLKISDGTITNNGKDLSGTSANVYHGGGVYSTGTMDFSGGTISNNAIQYNGGGIYLQPTVANGFTMTGGVVEGNKAANGGGIYVYTGALGTILNGGLITGNIARSYGGGILSVGATLVNLEGDLTIEYNQAAQGGGISNQTNTYLTIKDHVKINNNKATVRGGAYFATLSAGLHVVDDTVEFKDNYAETYGGAIADEGFSYLAGGQFIGNTTGANGTGDTIYTLGRDLVLMGGTYDSGVTLPGHYGIYSGRPTTSNYKTYVDFNTVTFQDKVYLDNAANKLYTLGTIPDLVSEVPLYLNKNNFDIGSEVVTKTGNITFTMKQNGTSYTYPYTPPTDISDRSDYFTGGVVPDKTQLGGYKTNIVLIGEGVYLDGVNGKDGNTGLTPTTAVKTYDRAEEILKGKIAEAKIRAALDPSDPKYDANGFEPYIYVCNTVSVNTTQTWKLDYTSPDFLQNDTTNHEGTIINETLPQLKRFSSHTGNVVALQAGGNLTLDHTIIDGNAKGVDSTKVISPLISVPTGSLVLQDSIIQNDFRYGIQVTGGQVAAKGNTIIKNFAYFAVLLESGSFEMMDDSQIINGYNVDADPDKELIPGPVNTSNGGIYVNDKKNLSNAYVKLSGNASVYTPARTGIYSMGRNYSYVSPVPLITLEGNSSIKGGSIGITLMNGNNNVAVLKDSARLEDNIIGVQPYGSLNNESKFTMMDSSKIIGSGTSAGRYGIRLRFITTSTPDFKLEIGGQAEIYNNTYGIDYYTQQYNVTTTIDGYAQIYDNVSGLHFENQYNPADGDPIAEVNILGHAKIRNNSAHGIDHTLGKTKINIGEDSQIIDNGQNGLVMGSTAKTAAASGSIVNISGNALIQGNGSEGIRLFDYYYGGTTAAHRTDIYNEVTLQGNAKVIGNGTTIAGSKGLLQGYGGTFILKDQVIIEAGIYSTGKLYMDGSVTVEEEIYLGNSKNPINLTSPITTGNEYTISCGDPFIGQIVVAPGGSLTSVDGYLSSFNKGSIFPEGRDIVKSPPNLIVRGENNVYMAGSGADNGVLFPGDDNNNGLGQGQPVATFERALEILKTLDQGANIVICNYPIDFGRGTSVKQKGDTWKFGPGGNFTNDHNQTWAPMVVRHEELLAEMFVLYEVASVGPAVFNLENITVDGNKDAFTGDGKGTSYIINNAANQTVNLNQGSVVQNNRFFAVYSSANQYGGAIRTVGTVNINGGKILHNTNNGQGLYRVGAGVFVNNGTLNMYSGEISDNYLDSTGLSSNFIGISAVGIMTYGGSSKVNLLGGEMHRNNTYGLKSSGNAMYIQGGVVTLGDVKITDNEMVMEQGQQPKGTAPHQGVGTVFIESGQLISNGATISNNRIITNATVDTHAARGGAIGAYGGTITLTNTNMENNVVYDYSIEGTKPFYSRGGAIYLQGSASLSYAGGNVINNEAMYGAAIYTTNSSRVTISDGIFKDNTPNDSNVAATGINSGIYVGTSYFQLKGGASIISDRFYLVNTNNSLILSGPIYQRTRLYTIDLGPNFAKGSVVVKPDNSLLTDATPYLRYFETDKEGFVLDKQGVNLVLKQAIYVDSVNGSSINSGASPWEPVDTIPVAILRGGNGNYIIFVSGPVYVDKNESYNLQDTAWITRYTGFRIPGTVKKYKPFDGTMITLRRNATLSLYNVRIYGRREIDSELQAGPIIEIKQGSTVNTAAATSLSLNTAKGNEHGAGIYINQGTLNWKGGTINSVSAKEGSAIYHSGKMVASETSHINGEIFLDGQGVDDAASAFIQATQTFVPKDGTRFQIGIANPYNRRKIIEYPQGVTPNEDQIKYYYIDPAILSIYSLVKRTGETNVLELWKREFVYIDGQNGDDNEMGGTPETAVKTFDKAVEMLEKSGGVILVVDEVVIGANQDITLSNISQGGIVYGSYQDTDGKTHTTNGRISVQRYARPTAWNEINGYSKESYLGDLITINVDGILRVSNLAIDGHSIPVVGEKELASESVEATGRLVAVEGTFYAGIDTNIGYNINKTVGAEGSGVYIADGGTMNGTDFKTGNLTVPNDGKGSDIYQGGTLILYGQPAIGGRVHLSGKGAEHPEDDRYITIGSRGSMTQVTSLEVTMDYPYPGRPVVEYPGKSGNLSEYEPTLPEINLYILEDYVKELYDLRSRETAKNILELQHPKIVYINGQTGDDTLEGKTPVTAVKTFDRAYELFKNLGGGILYIVDTVDVTEPMLIKNNYYESNSHIYNVVGGYVKIRRYVLPDKQVNNPNYVESNLGSLIEVKAGGNLTLQNVEINGHKNPIQIKDEQQDVSGITKVKAPLVVTRENGTFTLGEQAILSYNYNVLTDNDRIESGSIYNEGNTYFDGGTLTENTSLKNGTEIASGIYQDGEFTIVYGSKGIGDHQIYLASHEVDGENLDREIHVQSKMDQGTLLHIDVDRAEAGRNIAIYDSTQAYEDNVDNEYIYYELGDTITIKNPTLYLVESIDPLEKDTLELQDYRMLDVVVPAEIFLLVHKDPPTLPGNPSIRNGQIESPEYEVKNNSNYQVKVSVIDFYNDNASDNILYDPMKLVDTAQDLTAPDLKNKLFIAIEAANQDTDNAFKDLQEVPLSKLEDGRLASVDLGLLEPKTGVGVFAFKGEASKEFIEEYLDENFDQDNPDNDTYIKNNARAKYKMVYKFELVR